MKAPPLKNREALWESELRDRFCSFLNSQPHREEWLRLHVLRVFETSNFLHLAIVEPILHEDQGSNREESIITHIEIIIHLLLTGILEDLTGRYKISGIKHFRLNGIRIGDLNSWPACEKMIKLRGDIAHKGALNLRYRPYTFESGLNVIASVLNEAYSTC